jgi:hypothetical protein
MPATMRASAALLPPERPHRGPQGRHQEGGGETLARDVAEGEEEPARGPG